MHRESIWRGTKGVHVTVAANNCAVELDRITFRERLGLVGVELLSGLFLKLGEGLVADVRGVMYLKADNFPQGT